jgi:hypothetical protein
MKSWIESLCSPKSSSIRCASLPPNPLTERALDCVYLFSCTFPIFTGKIYRFLDFLQIQQEEAQKKPKRALRASSKVARFNPKAFPISLRALLPATAAAPFARHASSAQQQKGAPCGTVGVKNNKTLAWNRSRSGGYVNVHGLLIVSMYAT